MTAWQARKYSIRLKRRRFVRRLLAVLLLGALALAAADRNVKPLVFSLAEARSAALASRVLNSALADLEEAVDNFATLDMETLNRAIENLNATIEPMAKFLKRFS